MDQGKAERNAADLGVTVEEYLDWINPASGVKRDEERRAALALHAEQETGEERS